MCVFAENTLTPIFLGLCFLCFHSDLSLDTKLELLKTREYAEYTYKTVPEFKDGRYKGQWKNAKPDGR